MDRMTTVSAALFLAADVFAIVSLAMPDWIVTDVGGKNENLQKYVFLKSVAYAKKRTATDYRKMIDVRRL